MMAPYEGSISVMKVVVRMFPNAFFQSRITPKQLTTRCKNETRPAITERVGRVVRKAQKKGQSFDRP